MKKIINYFNKYIYSIVVLILILVPLGTILIQLSRIALWRLGIPVGDKTIFVITAWKEILLVIAFVLVTLKSLIEKKLPFKLNRFDIFILVFSLFGLIYGGFLIRKINYIVFGFRYDFLVLFYYFLGRSIRISRNEFLNLIKKIIYVAIPIMIFGALQTLILPRGFMQIFGYSNTVSITGNPLPPYHLFGDHIVRAMSTFAGPNSFAFYCVAVFFLIWFFADRIFKNKYLKYLLLALTFLALVFTFSRTYIIATIVISFVLLIAKYFKKIHAPAYFRKYPVIILTVLSFIFLIVVNLSPFAIGRIAKDINNENSFLFRANSSESHLFMRELAIKGILEHPFGHGIATSGLATTNVGEGVVTNPESWFFQLVFEYGILVFIFVFALLYFLIGLLYNIYNKSVEKTFFIFFLINIACIFWAISFLPAWYEVGSIIVWILFGIYISNFGELNHGKKEI
ncbi:MAG: O-antigen ligase family protein [Patescibacteria group bacterium]|nr:O-antigen ligase family protein [Patescibacteria group bacterium]